MESIKQSIEELALHFNTKMSEFQQNLQSSVPATSPTSNIAAQFNLFRSFVLSALEGLQLQVEILTKQQDQMEMRGRKKILLVHGIRESKNENVSAAVLSTLSDHMKTQDLSLAAIGHCHRLGRTSGEKPRPILLKFKEYSLRNKVWFSKTCLKNTGITLSEFLTKSRHETFMAARQHFGISNCWTKDGQIVIVGPDGKRHHIISMAELSSILSASEGPEQVPCGSSTTNTVISKPKIVKTVQSNQASRTKRTIKK